MFNATLISAGSFEFVGRFHRMASGRVVRLREALKRLIGAYAGASLFRESMEIRLIESGGPITGKGRTRALFTAYLAALDRETKLAQLIGLERKQR